MKSITVPLLLGALIAAVHLAHGYSVNPTAPRSPVGKCPAKDGEMPVYLPDSADCQIFYECSAGNATEKQCMQGLCFDTQLNVCAFPKAQEESLQEPYSAYSPIGTCPPRDTNTTIFLPDGDNCTIYYLCSNGQAIQNVCPPEMSWNTDKNICDWEVDVGCQTNVTLREQMFSTYSPIGTCPPRDTNTTIFLPDGDNCTIYYLCSNGQAIQNVCPPEMSWNTDKNICDWEVDVGCQTNVTLREQIFSTYSPIGTCPPRDTNTTIFLPDGDNCTIYYLCSNGQAIQNVCPPDMSWNTDKNICDWEVDIGCLTGKPRYISQYSAVGNCPPRDTNVTVFLPDSEDCTVYYACSNGNAIKNVCPPEMAWNSNSNICDWEIDAGCTAAGQKGRAPRTAVGECPAKDPATPIFLPDSERCDIYYECSGGIPFQNDCPPDMEFNPLLMVCDWAIDSGCKGSHANSTDAPSSTSTSSTSTTTSPTTASPTTATPTTASPTTASPTTASPTTASPITSVPTAARVKHISAYTAIGECPPRNGATPVYLPDSESCSIYYVCSNGVPIQNVCPPNLLFNLAINACDWELNVECDLIVYVSLRP